MLSACATRPVTEGVTGMNSYWIAQAARCEIRDSIINLVSEALAADGRPDFARHLARRDTGEDADIEESRRFEDFLTKGIPAIKNPEISGALARYSQTIVAYEFDFNITQGSGVSAGADLLGTITRGTVTTPIGAAFEGQRNTSRNFKLIDLFGQMLTDRPTIRECNFLRRPPNARRIPNGVYPMAGTLNLREIIDTFISLTQSANLVGNFIDKRDVPTFSETMTFTTTLSAGFNPTLKMEPLKRGLEVEKAGINLTTRRQDVHKLTLTFTLPAQGGATVTRQRAEQAEAALDELERQRIRQIDAQTEEIRRRLLGL